MRRDVSCDICGCYRGEAHDWKALRVRETFSRGNGSISVPVIDICPKHDFELLEVHKVIVEFFKNRETVEAL